MSKIAVLGHQEITKVFVNTLVKEKGIDLALGASLNPNHAVADDCVDMASVYNELGCNHIYINDYSLRKTNVDVQFASLDIDIIMVVGWSRLIPTELVNKFTFIGWHGGAFPPPRCRGRAGVNWALINRHRSFYYYTMLLDSGVDTGKILAIKDMPISNYDTTRTIYLKLGFNLVDLFLVALQKSPQDLHMFTQQIEPTLLPGRKPEDGLINWYQSDNDIDLFIRALSSPYPNAFSLLSNGNKILIKSGRPLGNISSLNLKPGEIYQDLVWGGLIVGCASGNYLVEEYLTEEKQEVLHQNCFVNSSGVINSTIKY